MTEKEARDLTDKLNEEGLKNQKAGEEERKRDRIQDLQDQRTAIHDQMRFRIENFEKLKEGMRQSQIIGGGAKAVIDMYQKAAGDAPLVAIQKAIKALQEKDTINLAIIAKEIVKQERVRPGGG